MPRYVAFLRGVSPQNAKMPELKRCFEGAGFSDVRTLLSSGNVAFTSRTSSPEALERRAEKAIESELGRSFGTIVRPTCSIPDDCIDSKRYPLFMARSVMRALIEQLKAEARGVHRP